MPDLLTDDQRRDLQAGRVWLPNGTTLGAIVQACDVAGIDQDDVILHTGEMRREGAWLWEKGIRLTVERDG